MYDLLITLKNYYELEEEFSKFYCFLSEVFEKDEEVSKFFSKLYMEEEQHKSMVLYQMKLIKTNPLHFRNIKINGTLLKKTKDYLRSYLTKTKTFQLDECLQVTLLAEACTMESYFSSAFNSLSFELENLTKSMQKESQNHYEKIKKFMEKKGFTVPEIPQPSIEKVEELDSYLEKCFQNV